jgi:hypothetical protein
VSFRVCNLQISWAIDSKNSRNSSLRRPDVCQFGHPCRAQTIAFCVTRATGDGRWARSHRLCRTLASHRERRDNVYSCSNEWASETGHSMFLSSVLRQPSKFCGPDISGHLAWGPPRTEGNGKAGYHQKGNKAGWFCGSDVRKRVFSL